MQDQSHSKARAALDILDQAWAYYTPEKRPESQAPVYETLPIAA